MSPSIGRPTEIFSAVARLANPALLDYIGANDNNKTDWIYYNMILSRRDKMEVEGQHFEKVPEFNL